jgi:hypothetical protein
LLLVRDARLPFHIIKRDGFPLAADTSCLLVGDMRSKMSALESVHRVVAEIPQAREAFWRTFMNCAKNSPASVRIVVAHLVLYLHLGPFSRQVIAAIDRRIAALDNEILDAGVIGAERAERALVAQL